LDLLKPTHDVLEDHPCFIYVFHLMKNCQLRFEIELVAVNIENAKKKHLLSP